MKEYIDRMLHLTSDIAEELLALKDYGSDITPELCDKIITLGEIAAQHVSDGNADEPYTEENPLAEFEAMETVAVEDNALLEDQHKDVTEREKDAVTDVEIYESAEDEQEADATVSLPQEELPEEDDREAESALPEELPVMNADAEDVEEEELSKETEEVETLDDTFEDTMEEGIDEPEPISDNDMPEAYQPHFSPAEIRNAFTLNDIFLYQRVLFGGVPQRFKDTLEAIAQCRDMDEVKAYLADVQKVNVRSDDAKDFLDIVRPFVN